MRRRTFLSGVGGGVLASSLAALPAAASPAAASPADFAGLRQRARDLLTGGAFDAAHPVVARYVAELDAWADEVAAKIDRRAGRDRVFEDLPLDPANTRTTYDRLRDLALACATPGLARYADPGTRSDVLSGLRTAHDLSYHAGAPEAALKTWWFWEIGSPRPLLWTCLLLGDALPTGDRDDYIAAVRDFVPDPTHHKVQKGLVSVGANRSDLCEIAMLDGMLDDNEDRLLMGRSTLATLLPRTTGGPGFEADGFYADGSFIQHGVFAYTGSYGIVLLGGMARQFQMLADTPWAITDPRREEFFGVIEDSFAPVVHDGKMMDFVRGRAISLQLETDRIAGYATMEHILRLAQAAGPEQALRWKGLVKGWVARDTALPSPPSSIRWGRGPARVTMLAQVMDDPAVPAIAEREEHRQFPVMDRAVHRRSDWACAISMSSRRIGYYEGILSQNKHGWHTGSGMTYLYDADAGQFTDAFWPTVDPYRLPGTTVDTTPLDVTVGSGARPGTSWVGGAVASGGSCGVVGMDLQGIIAPRASQVRGRKTWFCLDDRVVALGAGITGGGTVRTGTDLARGADVEVSSVLRAGTEGAKAVDGRFADDSRWLSATDDPAPWLVVSLDRMAALASISVYSGYAATNHDETSTLKDFTVEVRTADGWVRVADIVGNVAHKVEVTDLDVVGDQVRLSISRASGSTTNVARVFEVEVYQASDDGESDRFPVVTTIENRNLHAAGTNALIVDGHPQPSDLGWSQEFTGAEWAHLDGVGGYVFPGGAPLRATRQARTGTWRGIDSGTAPGTTDPVTRRYLTLSVEHGVEPRDETYAYMVLPGASAQRTRRAAADRAIEIAANSARVQAVRELGRDRVMAAFFEPESVAGITVNAPVAVIVELFGNAISLSVADPTRAQQPIRITLDRHTSRVLTRDPELEVTTGARTTLTATLAATNGGTRTARLLLA
ncbi:polysaccharide lyase beta-sandwich domain-containing protein [Saccharopolyspora indica]|uniref:polysaccharide lyase family 8 super-sandwich domain-containing protein n=1 Tax=Saccharopolyspora indica TaxID=1229659 RepID=UPI0022EA3E5D|nr:polysaccharide lyase family 8 super-sandwich domain-containing protein [Saccharopolyspora indica]MDA3645820.1 polysaccharide lyase beta-sandwich domain-containing protein [Saccharopolyspora indica]